MTSTSSNDTTTCIRQLPKEVVDRIAAGEVVARPANALKELVENSLDGGATKIVVQVDKASKTKSMSFSISDNGHGIVAADLPLAATRFATSKLTKFDDFQQLSSFGFRGEALASISMVSHLTITSRSAKASTANECTYVDGKPTQAKPKRCARTLGTTVKVNDLFYNVPHRKKALRADEYSRTLQMLQPYAVQVARKGVGMIVQQQGKKAMIDLNTSNLPKLQAMARLLKANKAQQEDSSQFLTDPQKAATKQVIASIYGSFLEPHLLYFQAQSPAPATDNTKQQMNYTCEGFLTAPSLAATSQTLQLKQAALLLFVNGRMVDCPPLKRQLEELYQTLTAWKKAPLLYLTIQVPPTQVDVNVHPSKTQVALLFLEEIVADLAAKIQTKLEGQGKTFGEKQKNKVAIIENPYLKNKKAKKSSQEEAPGNKSDNGSQNSEEDTTKKRKRSEDDQSSKSQSTKSSQSTQRRRSSFSSNSQTPTASQLVRTNNVMSVGALEPFLVRQVKNNGTPSTVSSTLSSTTLSMSQQSTQSQLTPTQSQAVTPASSTKNPTMIHRPPCPFATATTPSSVDMSQPGAFAQMAQQCTCRQTDMQQQVSTTSNKTVLLPQQTRVVRPAAVVPTDCPLASVRTLRRRIQKKLDTELQQKLRQAYFVGVVSEHRSLVQYQEELCMLHHTNLAEALFYQLALYRFGDNRMATLGRPVQVQTIVEQVLQMEEDLQDQRFGLTDEKKEDHNSDDTTGLVQVNETNSLLAKQATACLWDKASMLEEYFGIRFEKQQVSAADGDDEEVVVLTGLPILLEGHAPPPHGLPLFLLRLATEVDWEEERPCFDSVCRELGGYYAQLPGGAGAANERKALVQHTLFPALSCLLLPSHRLKGEVKPLTLLSNLIKVFER